MVNYHETLTLICHINAGLEQDPFNFSDISMPDASHQKDESNFPLATNPVFFFLGGFFKGLY
ncbi:MAG: hypothetical protein Q4A74_07575 [Cardiobacteriaceae bacterium]|nr:hypothetical protein [Cardiobacteriaceae bacterium]